MNTDDLARNRWLCYLLPFVVVVVAAALRVWPLGGLGLRAPWLTFYPAVILVGLYGGLLSGIIATALSALVVSYWSPEDLPFLKDSGDWMTLWVFLFNCGMMSMVAEAMLRAQARARRAQAQAEAANCAKSVFLATMSHELRTPLNAILGFSNLLRTDPSIDGSRREHVDIINRSGEHLLLLINDVLDMAKIDAGRLVVDVKPFDLDALVREVTAMLRVRAEEKGLRLLLDQSAEFPRYVRSDESKLRQILINLIGNAIKYTDAGTVTLHLRTQPDKEGRSLVLEVEDTGVGISKSDQARIFDPFVQVGKSSAQQGTGLGLAIVREFVQNMGGRIGVSSRPGQGSLFRVELPAQAAAASEVCVAGAQGGVVGLAPGQPDFRVLIVEDQKENWLLLRRMLQDAGFHVEVAEDGAAGVESFRRFRPHFIWMDRRMPVMDGVEATRRIRAMEGGQEVKIAALTASAFTEERGEIMAAGMDDFVRKPYLPGQIFECMSRLLGVRYVYEEAPRPAPSGEAHDKSLKALLGLPSQLRRDLSDALVLGHVDRLAEVTAGVQRHDPELARSLSAYFNRFDYRPVLAVLEGGDGHGHD